MRDASGQAQNEWGGNRDALDVLACRFNDRRMEARSGLRIETGTHAAWLMPVGWRIPRRYTTRKSACLTCVTVDRAIGIRLIGPQPTTRFTFKERPASLTER